MKKLLVILAVLATQMTSAFTKECPVVIATGPDYSWDYQYQLPKNYTEKLRSKLEAKGYKVADELDMGTYASEPGIFRRAAELEASTILFRPSLKFIPEGLKNGGEMFCNMGLQFIRANKVAINTEAQGKETKIGVMAVLNCDAAFRKVVAQIPECK